jgi:hypothetical protein
MTPPLPQIVLPALAQRNERGRWDDEATACYARRAASTWIELFIHSGSTARGDLFDLTERTAILDVWLEVAPATRLVACCWCDEDIVAARSRNVRPMAVMRGPGNTSDAVAFLDGLPTGTYVYSHPAFGGPVLNRMLAAAARDAGLVPAGAKLAKVSLDEISAIRRELGPEPALWDGSSRDIAASARAGATGVVATPLSYLPSPFPPRSSDAVQSAVNQVQSQLDRLPSRSHRSRSLIAAAYRAGARRILHDLDAPVIP